MPAFQACPGVASIEMIYQFADQPCENVYHVTNETGAVITTAELTDLAVAFASWETDTASTARSTNTQLMLIRARDLTVEAGNQWEQSESIDGTQAGAVMAQNVTISIKANTNRTGRSYRGRSFWIGMTEPQASNGLVASGFITGVTDRMNNLITVVSEVPPFKLAVLSRRNDGVVRPTGVATPIVNYVCVDAFVDSQRRRLPGHNRHR